MFIFLVKISDKNNQEILKTRKRLKAIREDN